MSLEELAAAIERQPDPPCIQYNCEWQGRCAKERLACRAFKYYVINSVSLPQNNIRWPKRQRGVKSIVFNFNAATPNRKHYAEMFMEVSDEN